jgi:hypothetical protein
MYGRPRAQRRGAGYGPAERVQGRLRTVTVTRPPVVAAPLTRSEEGTVADPARAGRAALRDGCERYSIYGHLIR